MQIPAKSILVTRPVNESLVTTAQLKGIELDVLSFIETEAIEDVEVQQEIEQAALQLATVVFTSMNAVTAVIDILDGQVPEWRIYCIGHQTQKLAAGYFGEQAIAGIADNAAELADALIDDEAEEVFFFCGNRRRNELPNKLQEHDILVNEVIVYQTKIIPHRIQKEYNAVLFFSPSAVESFFSVNRLTSHTMVYAIGNTTKEAVRHFCNNQVVKGQSPVKDELVELAINNLVHET